MNIKSEQYTDEVINFFGNMYINSHYETTPNIANIKKIATELEKCKSPIEKIMLSILRASKLIPIPQYSIGNYIADFYVYLTNGKGNGIPILIECDGHDFHEKTKEQAKHDKERDRFLQLSGYEIYRFTGSEIYNNPLKIYLEIRKILLDKLNFLDGGTNE